MIAGTNFIVNQSEPPSRISRATMGIGMFPASARKMIIHHPTKKKKFKFQWQRANKSYFLRRKSLKLTSEEIISLKNSKLG